MIQSFCEWAANKEIIEEGKTVNRSQFKDTSDGVEPQPHDFLVFGAEEFFNVATAKEKEKFNQQFQRGNLGQPVQKIDPPGWAFVGESPKIDIQNSDALRLGMITGFDNRNAEVTPIKGHVNDHVYAGKPANFRDVTDAFDTTLGGLPPKMRILAVMGLARHVVTEKSPQYQALEKKYGKWRSMASSHTDPRELALKASMSGREAARDEEWVRSRTEFNNFLKKLNTQIQQGEDVSNEIRKLADEFAEEGFVKDKRNRLQLHNLVNKAHEVLGSQNVAGEEQGPPRQEVSPLDRLMGGGQPGTQAEPQYSMQGRNVVANQDQMAAMAMAKKPEPESSYDRMKRVTMGLEHNQTVRGFNRLWKYHNDLRKYDYIEG